MEASETTGLLSNFPYSLLLPVAYSEPRDVLASERTCLSFVRFATALFFASVGIILNFRINSSEQPMPTIHTSSVIISYILLSLSSLILVISIVNYLKTVKRYASNYIKVDAYDGKATVTLVSAVVLCLLGVNIALLVESFSE